MKKELKKFAGDVYENSNIRYEIEGVFGLESFDNFREEFVVCVEKCIDEYKKQIQQIVAKHTEKLNWLKEEVSHWDEYPVWTDAQMTLNSECTKILAPVLADLNRVLREEE